MLRDPKILLSLTVAVLLGLAVYLMLPDRPSESLPSPDRGDSEAIERTVMDAARARVAAESRGTVQEPRVEAAPIDSAPASSGASDAPHPPDGYVFVASHGKMSKARMEPSEREPGGGREERGSNHGWLQAPDAIDRLVGQAAVAGRNWTFGWIGLASDASPDQLKQSLHRLNVQVLGSAGNLFRVKLPGSEARLQAIADLPEVDGLGAVPRERKLAEAFAEKALAADPQEQTPVFITLMTDDPTGQWRRALEDLGAVVGDFDPDIRVYVANVPYGLLDSLAEADFVLAIEPVGIVKAAHDTAVPAMGADALRLYDDSAGLFSGTGGASVPIAVMDTGLNINHLDISSNRESICGANFMAYEPSTSDQDLWVDEGLHGTHVTGTIAGNGAAEPRYAGMAPLVRHIRFAKVLHHEGFGSEDSIRRGMNWLSRPSGCGSAGGSSASVKPLVVNMSLGAAALEWEGRGAGERKLDSIAWNHGQLYVVSQANASIHAFSDYSTAKNSLAVGAVRDDGDLALFSSYGPTADGRLAPQVVGTGVSVTSTRGGGNRGGYETLSGTSMSSPAVAGVAALLMDAVPAFREQPALTRARLMASAIKPDAFLEDPHRFAVDNSNGPAPLQHQYGLGKVSARTSILNRDRADGWVSGSAVSELADGEYAYHDIVVPENASRLDLVMTWDEVPTDTITSAVLNDLDLWVDLGADCETAACGEYASRSRIDNVEWVIVRVLLI